ncbi:unnamed protein product [Cochlearia groenlandica]
MGNCLFGGLGDADDDEDLSIKVTKPDGEILKFHTTVTAGSISDEHSSSNYAIFTSIDDNDHFLKPLPHNQELVPGKLYYLLPNKEINPTRVGNCHVRSNSESLPKMTPYRMSLDYNVQSVLKRSYTDVFSRNMYNRTRYKEKKKTTTTTRRKRSSSSSKSGMWKVKLVINTDELLHILSEDGSTNELIESVRAVANGQNVVV